jgi:hypothetical protein
MTSSLAAQGAKVELIGSCLREGVKFVGVQPIAIGQNVTPPKKVREVKPSYPDLPTGTAASGIWAGEVLLGIDGKVAHLWTVREIHLTPPFPAFNAAIVEAVQQWEFDPVSVDGKRAAICMTASVTVDWR